MVEWEIHLRKAMHVNDRNRLVAARLELKLRLKVIGKDFTGPYGNNSLVQYYASAFQ